MNDGGNMAVSPYDSNVVFCAGNLYPGSEWNIAVSHTSDDGATWEHDTIPLGSNGLAVAFDPFDPNRVYVAGDSAYNYSYPQFLITTDMGVTWTPSHTGINGRIWTLATDPTQSGVLYCGTYQGVFKSTDAGLSWTGTGFTRDTRALVIDPTNPSTIYAGTYSNGVYVTTDAGLTWNTMNTGLANTKVLALALRTGTENLLFAGTEGGSVFRTSVLTGLSGPSFIVHRSSFIVISPNPCRSRACLEFTLPTSALARAAVYDHAGRMVADLGGRQMPQGAGTWQLDTKGIPAGTYFVRLSAGALTRTARLTVIE